MNLEQKFILLQESVLAQEQAFVDHRRHTEETLERIMAAGEENQRQLGQLIAETRGLLRLYQDLQGVGRVGIRIQSFLAWVAKWPLIGGGVYLVLDHLLKAWKG